MGKEGLTPSESIHRRRVLAEERRNLPPDFWEQPAVNLAQAGKRLAEIEVLSIQDLTPNEIACLTIEGIWLRFRLGRITQSERESCHQETLDVLETEQPNVFQWLNKENGDGLTVLARIRDKVIPSRRVGGYYTKRGRG